MNALVVFRYIRENHEASSLFLNNRLILMKASKTLEITYFYY